MLCIRKLYNALYLDLPEMHGIIPVDCGEVPHPDVHLTAGRHRQQVRVRTSEQRRVEAAPVHPLMRRKNWEEEMEVLYVKSTVYVSCQFT